MHLSKWDDVAKQKALIGCQCQIGLQWRCKRETENLPFQFIICRGEESKKPTTMATRVAARYASRRLFSSGTGKVLGEEEKAAENAYFKVTSKHVLLCSCFMLLCFLAW